MATTETEPTHEYDHDVVIVGGGPAGCSAGVFCAREGLDTAIFDRGRSSIKRCAHLENYLGFPAGIDIETFYERLSAHAREAGCTIRADLVESVEQHDDSDGPGFVLDTQDGNSVTVGRVIAATRYDGSYLFALDDMIDSTGEDGDTDETFDDGYPDGDGSTPVDGL